MHPPKCDDLDYIHATGRFSDDGGTACRIEADGLGYIDEEYHCGLKQSCGVERAQVRRAVVWMGHLQCTLRAFLRLEVCRQLRNS